ncbi:MAG: DEAD/DEAH box helicase, partial [Desulfobacteraceae bacterium]
MGNRKSDKGSGNEKVNEATTEMEALLQEQIERRRKRGTEEIVKVVNQGSHPVYSPFEVVSTSDRTYIVQIQSLTERINTCTCPDYYTNTIGTCKHIEGVLAHLEKKYARKWKKFINETPLTRQIYVHHADRTTVRLTLPFPQKGKLRELLRHYFDSKGILQGNPVRVLPAFLSDLKALGPRVCQGVHVGQDVLDYLQNQIDLESVQEQKDWFLEQVNKGNRSLKLISTKLYGFQEQGVLHLGFGGRVMLADDMGLGKTVQAIAATVLLKQLRDIQKVLIISPASLKHQWAREIDRFSSLSVQVIQGNRAARRAQYQTSQFFNIMNYELLLYDEPEISQHTFDLVILDEAQRIKNWRTKTADRVKRLKSTYAFVLTGTPMENRLDELYSVFQFIDPTILGPLWRFNQRYYEVQRRPSGSYKVLGYKNLDELRQRIRPYVLRRVRDEVLLDLPERIDSNFFVEMTDPQWDAYLEYEHRVARLMAVAKRRPLTPEEHQILLGSLIKMRLICNALALHEPDIQPREREKTAPKLRELREIVSEEIMGNGHKAIFFSQWSKMLAFVEPVLDKLGTGYTKLTGNVPTQKRGALVERFFEDPECKVFLSTDAGGVGLNLQAATMVVNLDLPWNPAVLEQRIGRAHRHGQSKPVHVVNLIAKGTIEERMLDTLAAKRAIFDAALNEDSTVNDLSFKDAGQGVLQRLEVLLGAAPVTPELTLEPTEAPVKSEQAAPARPTLKGFADLLAGRYPGRVLLVRKAPQVPGMHPKEHVLVVVDRDPAEFRPEIEKALQRHYGESPAPELLLMEQEGYRALSSLTGPVTEETGAQDVLYNDPGMRTNEAERRHEARQKRLRRATKLLDQAAERLKLASVVLDGGFPEEVMRPVRQALGLTLNGFLCGVKDHDGGPDLPSSRLVEAELVGPGYLSADLAGQVDRIRSLTEVSVEDEAKTPPLGEKTAKGFIATIRELIDTGREQVSVKGMEG